MATRILVVDDSPTIRGVVSAILRRHGYEARLAADGQEAFELLARGEVEPALVLLDFVMPRMNGYQFCRALREHAQLATVPVVLMSAKGDRIRERFAQQTGAIDAITKPFDAQELVAVVENALRRANAARASAAQLSELDPDDATVELPFAEAEAQRTSLARGGGADVSLSGDLAVVPIGAIFRLLQSEHQSGLLVCTSGSVEVRATFREGAIDFVQSTGTREEFRLGRFFVAQGIVTPTEIDQVAQKASSDLPLDETEEPLSDVHARDVVEGDGLPIERTERREHSGVAAVPGRWLATSASGVRAPTPLGMALLAAGKITPSQLRAALSRQASELLYEVFRWREGRFELRREPPSALAESASLGLSVGPIVMEGLRRVDEWRALEHTLGSLDAVVVRDDAGLGEVELSSLAPRERAVLHAIDGERTVRAVASATHLSSFEACRILVQLLEARVVRRRSA